MDSVNDGESHTDPKQLRKLRQQQLQQKFRREMETRMQQQKPDQAKCEDTEVPIERVSSGGLEDVPALRDSTSAGHRNPSCKDEHLADDPELWDFTLDGIDLLDVPADGPPSRALLPSTPGNHNMQTRSKTPLRAPGRPPDQAPSYSGGQDQAQYRPPLPQQYQARPDEVISPYRQGQYMKKRRLDT